MCACCLIYLSSVYNINLTIYNIDWGKARIKRKSVISEVNDILINQVCLSIFLEKKKKKVKQIDNFDSELELPDAKQQVTNREKPSDVTTFDFSFDRYFWSSTAGRRKGRKGRRKDERELGPVILDLCDLVYSCILIISCELLSRWRQLVGRRPEMAGEKGEEKTRKVRKKERRGW